jgi:Family of unknown function (DUF5681)
MTLLDEPTTRDMHGRFMPGRSGNPNGKAPGTRNRATALKAALRDGEDEMAARVVIERATGGDFVAARFLLDRLEPKPRTRPLPLDLPPDADIASVQQAIYAAFVTGQISPNEALAAARYLDDCQSMRDATDEARAAAAHLAALERENTALRAELAAAKTEGAPAIPAPSPADLIRGSIAAEAPITADPSRGARDPRTSEPSAPRSARRNLHSACIPPAKRAARAVTNSSAGSSSVRAPVFRKQSSTVPLATKAAAFSKAADTPIV